MPNRPNTESRIISALINSGDVTAAPRYGVAESMFVSHSSEYRWLVSFPAAFGHQPSVESLKAKFPDFPYSPDYTDVAFICSEVRQSHDQRQLVKAIKDASEAIYAGDIEEAYSAVHAVARGGQSSAFELSNALHDETVLDYYEEPLDKIVLPWPTLQEMTGGAEPGGLWYWAARLGQGKSWTLAAITRQALLEGKRVAMFSLEMPKRQVLTRIHAILAPELGIKVRHTDLKGRHFDPISYRKLLSKIKEEVPGELFVIDSSKGQITTADIASLTNGMDLVLIDYAGLLASPLGRRAVDDWRNMAAISNVLKEIAATNNLPIISAAQINREGESGGSKPPKVNNLAQSDALGQDADVVVTMKRLSKTVMVYSLEKNRDGEGHTLWYSRYLPNEGRFEEIKFERARDLVEIDTDNKEEI
jgi:replicative DNA helicase